MYIKFTRYGVVAIFRYYKGIFFKKIISNLKLDMEKIYKWIKLGLCYVSFFIKWAFCVYIDFLVQLFSKWTYFRLYIKLKHRYNGIYNSIVDQASRYPEHTDIWVEVYNHIVHQFSKEGLSVIYADFSFMYRIVFVEKKIYLLVFITEYQYKRICVYVRRVIFWLSLWLTWFRFKRWFLVLLSWGAFSYITIFIYVFHRWAVHTWRAYDAPFFPLEIVHGDWVIVGIGFVLICHRVVNKLCYERKSERLLNAYNFFLCLTLPITMLSFVIAVNQQGNVVECLELFILYGLIYGWLNKLSYKCILNFVIQVLYMAYIFLWMLYLVKGIAFVLTHNWIYFNEEVIVFISLFVFYLIIIYTIRASLVNVFFNNIKYYYYIFYLLYEINKTLTSLLGKIYNIILFIKEEIDLISSLSVVTTVFLKGTLTHKDKLIVFLTSMVLDCYYWYSYLWWVRLGQRGIYKPYIYALQHNICFKKQLTNYFYVS